MEILTESIITEQFSSFRIDRYLAEKFDYLSRARWQKEILAGKIYYNGKQIFNYHKRVSAGDIISYDGKSYKEPEVDRNYAILYEDDFILGINKPGNLPVHPAGIFLHNTLLSMIQERFNRRFYPLHRIDRETSGIVIMTKSAEVASAIQKNYHTVKKTYVAIVQGNPEKNEFTINAPIGIDVNSKIINKRAVYDGAKDEAITHFKKILSFNNYSLIQAIPVTGRQHQIRVHLKHAGYPILGDKLYGCDEQLYLEYIKSNYSIDFIKKFNFHRSALHARSISFFHPVIKKEILIKASLPEDYINFITCNDYSISF